MLPLMFAVLLPVLSPGQASPPPAGNPPAAARSAEAPVLQARSFTGLFAPHGVTPPADSGKSVVVFAPSGRAKGKTKVVCGMTLIIVDGSIDPKMALSPTGGADPDPRMPRVPKPMCGNK